MVDVAEVRFEENPKDFSYIITHIDAQLHGIF